VLGALPFEKDGATFSMSQYRFHMLFLTVAFLLTLPLVNPLVHGDGVGYYAYLRAPLIQHNLRFEDDWRSGNLNFSKARLASNGDLLPSQFTDTGYINNLFTVGPAILWTPFFILAHASVVVMDWFGGHVPANGFSPPYRIAVALGTAFYGFCGLLLSYDLTRKYVDATWALLATIGIWAASSLPVYMYFNPFWSHAHSAFIVALFIWFWDRTSPGRTVRQWAILGLISGLMLNVYFLNGVFLLIPFIEAIQVYVKALQSHDRTKVTCCFSGNILFLVILLIAVSPTLITRRIVFGGFLRFGSYTVLPWDWRAPYWRSVLFSSDHGLFTWTPLLSLALLGLLFPSPRAKTLSAYCAIVAGALYFVIASYPFWSGMSSFGNRFFISLTPIFVLGLAMLLDRLSRFFRSQRLAIVAQASLVGLFAVWNVGFIFQWGTHMIPVRGHISWSEMARNQFVTAPLRLKHNLAAYFLHRQDMMQQIEQEDSEQQKTQVTDQD
jgi:hypothetical protein